MPLLFACRSFISNACPYFLPATHSSHSSAVHALTLVHAFSACPYFLPAAHSSAVHTLTLRLQQCMPLLYALSSACPYFLPAAHSSMLHYIEFVIVISLIPHAHTHKRAHTHKHTYKRAHTHTHKYTHTITHTQSSVAAASCARAGTCSACPTRALSWMPTN
jgi:hypothetical protein